MSEIKKYQLSKEEERMIAELSESKYFDVINRLKEVEREKAVDNLTTLTLSDEALRYWQGYAAGVEVLPDAIKRLHKEIFENPQNE